MRVASLALYPVKSTAGLPVDRATVQPWGLAGDRRWSVVDDTGARVTAWKAPELFRVRAVPTASGLRLSAPDQPDLDVDYPDPAVRQPSPHSRLAFAVPASADAGGWLSRLLDRKVSLLWLDDPTLRPMSASHGGLPGDTLSLADAGPVLLTSQASLAELDRWVAQHAAEAGEPPPEPLAMARFRPNVVIDGELAFAEDCWQQLRIGSVTFRRAELCDRCVITTIDPTDLSRGKEPLRTLAKRRRWDGNVWFGLRLTPVQQGTIEVGDAVEVLARTQ